MIIGPHVSIANGILGAAQEALSYGANTFMIYTGAPQNTIRVPLSKMKIPDAKQFMIENGIDIENIVVHAPYIINLASHKSDTYQLAVDFLKKEMERTEGIGAKYLVIHPGSYTEKDLEYGITRISEGLNSVLTPETKLQIALETMSGKGTEIGRSFEELSAIIERVHLNEKLCVCFDTCHTHDSGYDIIDNFDDVINEFDKVIGLSRLKIYHVNGSLNKRGAKKDRHANIGAKEDNPKGVDYIGYEALSCIVHHPKNDGKIFILETPWLNKTENLYKQEIEMLRCAL